MANRIGRDILKQFLPNHETIVAFEKLLKFANETAPNEIEEILALVSSVKRVNTGEINNRLAQLEIPLNRGRDPSQAQTDRRIAEIEVQLSPRANLSSIYARLDALEANQVRRENSSALTLRIENIEKFLGV